MKNSEMTAFLSFTANILLFILKLAAAITSGSLAVLSSAFDSFNDIISYFLGYYSIKEAARGPDFDHPYGHRRLEPLAGLVLAILAGVLSIEILRSALTNIFVGKDAIEITAFTFGVLIVTAAIKSVMYVILRDKAEKAMSTALDAMAMDSRNDVLSNTVAMIGIGGAYFGIPMFDDIAAILIAAYIARSGYVVAKKNIDYIVGARPDEETIGSIREKARVKGVERVGTIRAHYVGDRVHAEIDIVLHKGIDGPSSHNIAVRVQKSVESLKMVSRAFVHIDYE
ncbi:MAG: cation diffusion facilitator family transporter [Candidatus Micrarchaeota archaeon]